MHLLRVVTLTLHANNSGSSSFCCRQNRHHIISPFCNQQWRKLQLHLVYIILAKQSVLMAPSRATVLEANYFLFYKWPVFIIKTNLHDATWTSIITMMMRFSSLLRFACKARANCSRWKVMQEHQANINMQLLESSLNVSWLTGFYLSIN